MSFEALRWAAGLKVGSPAGRSLLWTLADAADKNGKLTAGQRRLADKSELAPRTVFKWLAAFEASGWISRRRRQRQTGSRTSDEIQLLVPGLTAPRANNQIARGASSKGVPPIGLIASDARSIVAPHAEVTRSTCEALTSKNNLPLNPHTSPEADMAVRDVFTVFGVTPETAEALIVISAQQGKPLTVRAAQKLIRGLGEDDPETECAAIVARASELVSGPLKGNRVTAGDGERYVAVEVAKNRPFAMACLASWRDVDGKDRSWMASQNAISIPERVIEAARAKLSVPKEAGA